MLSWPRQCIAILVAALAVHSATAAEVVIVEAGRPVQASGEETGWRTVDDALQASGLKAKLTAGVGLGPGDFEIRTRLEIRKLAKSAAAFLIGGSYFGFEGGHGKVFLTGSVFGGAHGTPIGDPKDFLRDGVPFELVVSRTGNSLRIVIDGKTVWTEKVGVEPLGPFGFIPWRATMRIHSCVAKGNVDKRFLTWRPPSESSRKEA